MSEIHWKIVNRRSKMRFNVCGVVMAAIFIVAVESAITFSGPNCGTKVCRIDQYCSNYIKQCEDCNLICDSDHHNFDNKMCSEQCQDYLHDIRYTKSAAYAADSQRLQKQLNFVTAICVLLFFLVILSNGIQCFRWCRRRGIYTNILRKLQLKKPSETDKISKHPDDLTHVNPHTQSPKVQLRNQNRPQLPAPPIDRQSSVFSVDAPTIHTVSTPISTRLPAEDSTLDYTYENGGLVTTPTIPDRPKTETTF